MRVAKLLTRRQVIAAGAVASGLAAAGCSDGGPSRPSPHPTAASTVNAVDARLRQRAIADERRLLAACANTPNATAAAIREMHVQHLQRLTGERPALPASSFPAAPAALAAAERKAAGERRQDCVSASSALAPLLASIAAASEIAVVLLTP